MNWSWENRVVISRLEFASQGLTTYQEKKDHNSKVVAELMAKAYITLDPKPTVTKVIVNLYKNQTMLTIEAKFH